MSPGTVLNGTTGINTGQREVQRIDSSVFIKYRNLTSTGALSITSGSGNNVQSAGTGATANVVIGAANGGVGSLTPDLIVVDKTSTTLPTGVEVSNSDSTGKFNVYESGAWKVLCNKTDAACGAGSGAALSAILQQLVVILLIQETMRKYGIGH